MGKDWPWPLPRANGSIWGPKLGSSKIDQKVTKSNQQRHVLGQNELTSRFSRTTKSVGARKRLFGDPFSFGQNLQGGPFGGQNRKFEAAPNLLCVVRLRSNLIWKLFRACFGPQNNLSANAPTSKEVEASRIGDFGTFQNLAKIDLLGSAL